MTDLGFDRPYVCAHCRLESWDSREFGRHLERHREIGHPRFCRIRCTDCSGAGSLRNSWCASCLGTGRKMVTVPCPRGCGRHFLRKSGDHRGMGLQLSEHIVNCDGSRPIPSRVPVLRVDLRGRAMAYA